GRTRPSPAFPPVAQPEEVGQGPDATFSGGPRAETDLQSRRGAAVRCNTGFGATPAAPGESGRTVSSFPFGPRRSLARLAAPVAEPRQPPLDGQAVDGGQEPLQPGERLLAFQPDQLGGTPLPRRVPAARHLDLVLRDVLGPHQLEPRLADQPLV